MNNVNYLCKGIKKKITTNNQMTLSTLKSKIDFINTVGVDFRTKWLLLLNTILMYVSSKLKPLKSLINVNSISKYRIKVNHNICEIEFRIQDIPIFYEVMMEKVYHVPQEWIPECATFVDLGAHVGCTSVYFQQYHHIGTYLSVEPSAENFFVLQRNAALYPIICINKAIFDKNEMVKIDSSSLKGQNHHLSEVTGAEVDGISMDSLMKEYHINTIDLLKIDIEGTENILFKNKPDWLKSVRIILIELHGDYTVADLKNDISPYGFEIISSENPYGIKMICAHRMH